MENEWILLRATAERVSRYYVSKDGWLHLEVVRLSEVESSKDPRFSKISLTPEEFTRLKGVE